MGEAAAPTDRVLGTAWAPIVALPPGFVKGDGETGTDPLAFYRWSLRGDRPTARLAGYSNCGLYRANIPSGFARVSQA